VGASLPTWVGTVVARENLEAATSSTLALTGRETSTPVTEVMIAEADWTAFDLATGQDVAQVKLADIRAKMREIAPPSGRLFCIHSAFGVHRRPQASIRVNPR
jgi:hypothetical protein